MSNKKKSVSVYHRSAFEETMLHKPRYNPYQCGHGVQASAKDKRSRRSSRKQEDRRVFKDYL